MADSNCNHYWTPNSIYFCIHCGKDIHENGRVY